MLGAIALAAAIQVETLTFQELETYYWDCDTAFMKGEMGGQDLNSCLTITEEFQKHFKDRTVFNQYWNAQKRSQWARRGYRPNDGKDT